MLIILPFNKNCFNLVVALEIIEHVENPHKLLMEVNDVLISNGLFIISTPNRISLEGVKGRIQN